MSDPDTARRLAELEARLQTLERREQLLRAFVTPAIWDALDRLDTRTPPTGSLACLACGRESDVPAYGVPIDTCVFGGGRLERLECGHCGCVFGPLKYLQTPDPIVAADYRLLYEHYSEGDSTDAELRAFEMLDPQPGGLYLNWGSGAWSRSVEILRARGFDVWGYEPNTPSDNPFIVANRGEVSARFDGIFSNNVIEHLFSPKAQFEDFSTILKDDGRMVHASPCYAWSYAYTRFHVFFPLADLAAALAARTGYRIEGSVDDGDFQARLFVRG